MASEMNDLIARLEKATGPDHELFYECAHIVFGPSHSLTDVARWDRFNQLTEAEAWTDAALMLFPDGYAWELYSDGSGQVGPEPKPGRLLEGEGFEGATPALALCIAAMKARASKDKP